MKVVRLAVPYLLASALPLALVSSDALADASASLNISGLSMTVIDLRPDDGIAATATVTGSASWMYSNAGFYEYTDSQAFWHTAAAQSISTSASSLGSQASGTLDAVTGSLSMNASFAHDYLVQARALQNIYDGAGANTTGQYSFGFLLAPHTSIRLNGSIAISGSHDETAAPRMGMVVGGRYITALTKWLSPYNPYQIDGDEGHLWVKPEGTFAHDYNLFYANDTDAAQQMTFRAWGTLVASEQHQEMVPTDPVPVPEVPEPSAAAMLLAGLAGLAGLARRRARP